VVVYAIVQTGEYWLRRMWRHDAQRKDLHHRRNHQTTMKNQKTMTMKTMYHSQRHPCRCAMLFILRNVPERIPDVSAKASFIWLSCTVDSRTSFPIPIVMSFNNLTLALRPSSASSFWPSRSSAKRCPLTCGWCSWPKGEERPDAGGVTPRSVDRSRSEPGCLMRWAMGQKRNEVSDLHLSNVVLRKGCHVLTRQLGACAYILQLPRRSERNAVKYQGARLDLQDATGNPGYLWYKNKVCILRNAMDHVCRHVDGDVRH